MADTTIEWANKVWNPVTGCTKVSPGCAHCYAETVDHRFDHDKVGRLPWAFPASRGGRGVTLHPERLDQPLHWWQPRRIFVNSMSDLLHEDVPDVFIDKVIAVMAVAPWHTYQILTKRPDGMLEYFHQLNDYRLHEAICEYNDPKYPSWVDYENALLDCPLPNVWIGVSVENQLWADRRRPFMAELAKMGWLTWVSYEPALGPVNWTGWEFLRWMVSGGESGGKARPSHPDYHRGARDFCRENGIAYFFKQWGNWLPTDQRDVHEGVYGQPGPELDFVKLGKAKAGNLLDNRIYQQMPAADLG